MVNSLFRFELPKNNDVFGGNELISNLLGYLLDNIELTTQGNPVLIDGFRLLHETSPKEIFPINIPLQPMDHCGSRNEADTEPYQPLSAVRAAEPRIALLGNLLQSLLCSVELQTRGMPVNPDGFRVLKPTAYTVPSNGDPAPVISQLARWCDSDCRFCYLKSNPPEIAEAESKHFISDEELDLHIENFRPTEGQILFKSNWGVREVLADPRSLNAMSRIRRKTDHPFFFVTNGNHIDTQTARNLAALKPIFIIVSVNTLEPHCRQDEMASAETMPEIITALDNLTKAGVPYGASVTAWPGPLMNTLEETLRALQRFSPLFMRVNLPGYTKFNEPVEWDTKQTWNIVLETIKRIRNDIRIPIFSIPSLYEVETTWNNPLAARLMGVIPDSPADYAGLREGDEILAINGIPTISRMQLLTLFQLVKGELAVEYMRDTLAMKTTLRAWSETEGGTSRDLLGKYYFPRGLVMPYGLPTTIIDDVLAMGQIENASRIFLMTSCLLEKTVNSLIDQNLSAETEKIRLLYPTAAWLGGNMMINDMLVVGDFIKTIQNANPSPDDLVIIPASGFNEWGRDLTGIHWRNIQYKTGIRTRLLPCLRIPF